MNFLKFIISLGLPLSAGYVGSLFTTPSITGWYAGVNKPWFNPPDWIFAPVWTGLFILMGVALYLVWRERSSKRKKKAVFWFCVQLILNVLWSLLFFYLRNPLAAFVELTVLWVLILLTLIYFYRLNKLAGWLILPYILWVSFAGVLNFSIFWLNR